MKLLQKTQLVASFGIHFGKKIPTVMEKLFSVVLITRNIWRIFFETGPFVLSRTAGQNRILFVILIAGGPSFFLSFRGGLYSANHDIG